MKKFIFILLLFSSLYLFAYETNYPDIMNNGTYFINTGIGFGSAKGIVNPGYIGNCPPLTITIDQAIPIGGFPMTLGLAIGYFSGNLTQTNEHCSYMPIGIRFAYHFNFNIPRLQVYALLTIGPVLSFADNFNKAFFWFGLNAGSRYFFHPNIGAYIELGFDRVHIINFGFSFRL